MLKLLREAREFSKNPDGRTRWSFMSVFKIPSTINPDQTYLWRLRIIQTPLFGIYLHKIMEDDGNRDLHDHPYPFASLILKGGYSEQFVRLERSVRDRGLPGIASSRMTPKGLWGRKKVIHRTHKRGGLNVIRTDSAHRIYEMLDGNPIWTLMFVGPRIRKWGFWTPEGFVPWDEYLDENEEKRVKP